MIEGLQNQNNAEDRAVNRAEQRAAQMFANGGNALSMMHASGGGGFDGRAPDANGTPITNPGSLNGDLPIDDPDYDPILDLLPGVFVEYYRLGGPLGMSPLKP